MAPKRRDAVGYTLPGQDDTISQDNTNIDQGSTQARRESELRIRGAGVRHGAVGENGLPSGSSSTAPQGMLLSSKLNALTGRHGFHGIQTKADCCKGHSQPVTLDVATTSSSSYVPKPSQDQTQTQVRGPSLDHGPDGLYHEQGQCLVDCIRGEVLTGNSPQVQDWYTSTSCLHKFFWPQCHPSTLWSPGSTSAPPPRDWFNSSWDKIE